MLRLLILLLISFTFQACQVSEKVAGAKEISNNFPGSMLTTIMPINGWKKLGDDIDVTLLFSLPVTVTDMPYIEAQIGFNTRRFYYYAGDGTTSLTFRYSVTSADLDIDGIDFASNIELNGGALTYSPRASVIENVPTTLSNPDSQIKVDGIVPYITQVTAPAGGNYMDGQQLKYHLYYSEKVDVTGVPGFNLNLSSGTVATKYKSGSGTAVLEFSHLLLVTDADADGFTTGSLLSLNTLAGITIVDQAGNSISSSIYTTSSTDILINVIQPTIMTVTPPAAGTYTLSQNMDFAVAMSEATNITGTPAIPVVLNTGTVLATYLSGTGTSSLIFRYTVQTNHVDTDGITLISPMLLNGGTIENLSGTQNAALVYSVPSSAGRLVDAATGPYVVSTLPSPNGMYLDTQNINFTLNFSSIVNVTGAPRLPIIVGSSTVYASYFSGSGSSAIVFRYSPTTSHEDLDGISLSGPIDLNGGTIKDAANKAALLTYVPANTSSILVDGKSPAISSVSWTGSGNITQGQHLNFSVLFSEVVSVTGIPSLSITVGATGQNAAYISGTGTNTLNFRYTVQANDTDSNGIAIASPMLLNAGTIKDVRNHNAVLTFTPATANGYIVDGLASTVSLITAPINGTYKLGDTMDFVVNWTEPTFLSGNPRLVLTVGTSTLYATYVPVGSNSTSFIFRYTVLVNELDANGIATTGLQLNGGLIKDASGNNADLTFALPNLTLVNVDGVIPYVTILTPPADGTYKAGQPLNFNLTWNEDITVVGLPVLNLIVGSTNMTATFTSTGTNTATFAYIPASGDLDTNGITLLSAISLGLGVTIKDLAGNNSYLQINPPVLTGVKVDAVIPTISAIIPPPDATYKLADNLDIQVIWSEPVTVSGGTPRIAITIGATARYANYYALGSTPGISVFRYTVTNTDADANGITMTSPIDLNLATIQDAATNNATPSFIVPPMTGVLVDGVTATILSWIPVAPGSVTHGIGANFDVTVHWSENVDIDTTGGTPYVQIFTNTYHNAYYVSGTGTQDIVFRYTVLSGEASSQSWIFGQVYLNGGTIQDAALNNAYFTFPPTPNWIYYSGIKVDGIRPTVSSSSSANITVAGTPNYFKSAHTIEYNLGFSEAVVVTGTPRLTLTIGGATRYATYFPATSTTTSLRFRFIVDFSDVLLDLDGIDVATSIDMNGGSIKDTHTNDFTATFAFSEKDYVYYTGTMARYHISGSDYTASTASCPGGGLCVTGLTDIASGTYPLTTSSPGPKIVSGLSGFGTNLTSSMKFNSVSSLILPYMTNVKYVIFVFKTVPNPSITATVSSHTLLNRRYYTGSYAWQPYPYWKPLYGYDPTIKLTSTSSAKSILMNPTQKMKINTGTFPVAATATETGAALWVANTPYVMAFELSSAVTFDSDVWNNLRSIIGGSSFDGEIAEMIFLSATPALVEATHIDTMINQLNTIHGAY